MRLRGLPVQGAVVSSAATTDSRPQRAVRRSGTTHEPADDVDHPALVQGSPLRRHVLHRLPAARPPSG